MQGFHMAAVKRAGGAHSVPALVCDGERLYDSSDIVAYADRKLPDSERLLPSDPKLKDEVERWTSMFDSKLGPATRRLAYYHLLPHRRLIIEASEVGAPRHQRVLARILYPALALLMRKSMRIDADGAERSLHVIERVFDSVAEHLAKGAQYFVGNRFTAAELSFAALAAPITLPSQYGSKLPPFEAVPDEYRTLVERFRQHPAGAFALKLYGERDRVVATAS